MDGLNETSEIVNVRTWYDNALTGLQIAFVILTAVMLLMYIRDLKKQKSRLVRNTADDCPCHIFKDSRKQYRDDPDISEK